jgi:hypothetical protein
MKSTLEAYNSKRIQGTGVGRTRCSRGSGEREWEDVVGGGTEVVKKRWSGRIRKTGSRVSAGGRNLKPLPKRVKIMSG